MPSHFTTAAVLLGLLLFAPIPIAAQDDPLTRAAFVPLPVIWSTMSEFGLLPVLPPLLRGFDLSTALTSGSLATPACGLAGVSVGGAGVVMDRLREVVEMVDD